MQRETFIKSFNPAFDAETASQSFSIKPREPLPTLQSYCQSKTFVSHSGVNPLVAAASALFTLAGKLSLSQDYNDLDKLRENLIHEIKAFEFTAHTAHYGSDVILLARYAMCATIDEVIQCSNWGKGTQWSNDGLLYIFHGESWGGEGFFIMLNRLQQAPKQHIELLEFIYLCLSLGFQGKYRQGEDGQSQLKTIKDNLYQTIRQTKGDFLEPLSLPTKQFKKTKKSKHTNFSAWKAGLITAAVLVSVYFCFNYLFSVTAAPLQQNLNTIQHSIHHGT